MQRINDAVTAFADWRLPWTFPHFVRQQLDATPEDRIAFDEIWNSAIGLLAVGDTETTSEDQAGDTIDALRDRFPRLSDDALAAIVRAATYQWR